MLCWRNFLSVGEHAAEQQGMIAEKVKDMFTPVFQQSSRPLDRLPAGSRMPLRRHLSLSLLTLAFAAFSGWAVARPPAAERAIAPRMGEGDTRGQRDDALSNSVRRIERNTRDQVLSAERIPFDGRNVNRIKTVDEHGRVRVYMDDPQSAPPASEPSSTEPPSD